MIGYWLWFRRATAGLAAEPPEPVLSVPVVPIVDTERGRMS